jgi:hypothetical protein
MKMLKMTRMVKMVMIKIMMMVMMVAIMMAMICPHPAEDLLSFLVLWNAVKAKSGEKARA